MELAPLALGWEYLWIGLRLLSVVVLVGLNAFFVAAEFALVAVRATRVEQMKNEGVKNAVAVETAIHDLDRSIAATQLGITLASIALGFVGEPALARLIQPLFSGLPEKGALLTAHGVAIAIAFTVITFMHVVFGELIPKTVALQIPDTVALTVARPLLLFTAATRPMIRLMNGTGFAILRLAGFQAASERHLTHSVEELVLLIEDTEEAGLLDADQADFVQNVFQLSSKKVRECMVPREKMAALELSAPPEVILETVRQGAHTRLPVYDGEIDNIVGIVNTKDLFYIFSLQGVVVLQDALYPALYLRPDEPLSNAVRLFRKARRHMALVRDEDDRILGLITLEDVLEEIVGDIEDEHDQPARRPPRLVRRVVPRLEVPPVRKPEAAPPAAPRPAEKEARPAEKEARP